LIDLDCGNLAGYLEARGRTGPWRVKALGGGVSNTVLLADNGRERWVVKQSLGRLRVEEEWLADRERIHREASAIAQLGRMLAPGSVPVLAFSDPGNFAYAMEAASGARDWKSLLMAGEVSTGIARRAGVILRDMIHVSRDASQFSGFAVQDCFDQLRLDPYYRFTAARHPDLAHFFDVCIREYGERRYSLVHGDFSPKNLLVTPVGGVTLIDFEVIHYGNPAFDAAFLLNHLLLKRSHLPAHQAALTAAAAEFWNVVHPGMPDWFEGSVIRQLGCLHMARVDGKSPAEYLTPAGREQVRERARRWILSPPRTVKEILDEC